MGNWLIMSDNFVNIQSILKAKAKCFGKRKFIIYGSKIISFKEVDILSSKLAKGFSKIGLKPKDRVCLWLYNCPEFIITYFAVIKVGACVVPVNDMLKPQEVSYIVDNCKAKFFVTSVDKVNAALGFKNKFDFLKQIISFPCPEDLSGVISFYDIIEREDSNFENYDSKSDDVASIIYTSGTTGRAKGAMLTHGNFISNVIGSVSAINSNSREVVLCILPLFHSFAFTVCFLIPLYVGGKTVIMRSLSPFKRVIRAIIKNRVTVFVGVPSLFNILKEHNIPWFLKIPFLRKLNPVRLCISGAAALSKDTTIKFEEKFKMPLLQGYGLTEASPVVSLNPYKGLRKPDSVGIPLSGVKVKIDSPNVLDGVGELLVKGPNVMKGYLNMQFETEEVLKDDWLYTGDLATIDPEGYIYIVGRKKDMINVRGFNVYPREIEDVLCMHPDIKEAAVVGVDHPHKGEVPVAFVVKEKQGQVQLKELLFFLKKNLASYKIPFKIEFIDFLPKNTTGKVLKRNLRAEYSSR